MNIPSYLVALSSVIFYYFAMPPLVFVVIYSLNQIGCPVESMKSCLYNVAISLQVIIGASISIILLKKYGFFLLSPEWRKNFMFFVKIGVKWSIPILIVHLLISLIPFIRQMYIEKQQIIGSFSVNNAGATKALLFSLLSIVGAIAEELIFRGVILQKLTVFINDNKSVFITAALFAFSHFIYLKFGIGQLTSSFVVGLLCGYAFMEAKSCISAMLPHIINNCFVVGYLWI